MGRRTSTSCRRWRCSGTSSTSRSGQRSCRSPSSAPSGRRSSGRSNTTCRCEAIDLPLRNRSPVGSADEGELAIGELAAGRPSGGRPARRAGRGRRRPRPRALVGRRHRAPRRRRAGVRRGGRGDDGGARRSGGGVRCARRSARRTCARRCARRSPTATNASPSCAGRGTCRRSAEPLPPATVDAAHAARPAEGEGRASAGCRGPIAGSPRPPATAPACAARVGTRTCSGIPASRGSAAGSSAPRGCCATAACRPHPTISSRPHARPTTLAALRDRPRPGLAEVLDAADTVMAGSQRAGADRARAGRRRRDRRGARRRAAGAAGPRPGRAAAHGCG